MKKLIFLFLLCSQIGFSQSSITAYAKDNHKINSEYHIYGSILRGLVNVLADENSIQSIKNIDKITFYTIQDSLNAKKIFRELIKKSKEMGAEEYISVSGSQKSMLPGIFRKIATNGESVTILIKEIDGYIDHLTYLMVGGNKVTLISTKGPFKLEEILEMRLKKDQDLDGVLKIMQNVL